MKKTTINILWNILVLVLAASLIVLGIISANDMCTSLGVVMALVIVFKLIRLYFRMRTPEARKKYEEQINDERTNFIAGKAAIASYIALELTLLAILLYCVIMKIEVLLSPLSLVMFIGIFAYLIVYYVLQHRM